MKFENDYFLEDSLDIHSYSNNIIKITYDTLTHQSLERYLNGSINIIAHGSKLNKMFIYFDKTKYCMFSECKVIDVINYDNFITYTVKYNKIVNCDDIHLDRKIKIKKLLK